jgi:hypothetical protein
MIVGKTTFACNLDQQFGCGDLLAGARTETMIATLKATCSADKTYACKPDNFPSRLPSATNVTNRAVRFLHGA